MTSVLLYVIGIIIVLVGLAISIALHEIGHLVPAKLFGVKVTQYMIGFGKTIWSRKKGETEYGVKMLPLGGYVSMIGMYPPQKPGEAPRESTTGFLNSVVDEGPVHTHRGGSATEVVDELNRVGDPSDDVELETRRGIAGLVDEAREASAETIAHGEDHRTFYRLPVWKKIIIMLGGPFMNLILAFVFFGIVLSGFGVPQYSTTLGHVSECILPAESTANSCSSDDPAAPAAAAGLAPGDKIVSVDGTSITDWEQFRSLVSAAPGQALEVTVERDGAGSNGSTETFTLTPLSVERAVVDETGEIVLGDDGKPRTETAGMIGASPATEIVQQPVTAIPAFVGEQTQHVAGVIISLPERLVDTWQAAFGTEERDPNGPMSVVGVGRLAGEVASMDQAPIAARAQFMFSLLGSLNVALFVFNLVPLMPLDGGHVAGAIYEGIKRGLAKIRRKPDPGPVDTAKMVPVTFAVVIVLGAMSVLLMYADIVKPVSIFG